MKYVLTVVLAIFIITSVSFSQFEFLKKKTQEKTEKAIEEIIEGEEQETKEEEKKEVQTEEEPVKTEGQNITLESYSKYDFIPGEKIIFFDDFSQDAIGDFPAQWNTNGSAEIVTTSLYPGNWMKYSCEEAIWTDKLLNLPDNYTIEFDAVPISGENGNMAGYMFRLIQSINANSFDWGAVPGKAGFMVHVEYFGRPGYRTYINSEEGNELGLSGFADKDAYKQKLNIKYHIAIWVQKSRVRLYVNKDKVFDLPKAFTLSSVKMDRLRFEEGAALISNVRIAIGYPDLRNKLLTDGKLISYGLYFEVNKADLKPESYATLKGIADVLKDNSGLRIKIVGHTDGDGSNSDNLELSKKRAEAVKNELIKTFGIDPLVLESDGLGETQPIAANDTPANKALNRRVEFIKL